MLGSSLAIDHSWGPLSLTILNVLKSTPDILGMTAMEKAGAQSKN